MEFLYTYKDKDYPVVVVNKMSRSISYRVKDGYLLVYAPYLTSKRTIVDGLDRFAKKLFEQNPRITGRGDNYIYLLGYKLDISFPGKIEFNDGKTLIFKTNEELDRKLKKWFKDLLIRRTRFYENKMELYENKVSLRKMTTRYGSNSISNHSISYSTILMHYSLDVIDAIVVHELAHCKITGHKSNFYKLVYKYCPNYDELHKRLRKGEFYAD